MKKETTKKAVKKVVKNKEKMVRVPYTTNTYITESEYNKKIESGGFSLPDKKQALLSSVDIVTMEEFNRQINDIYQENVRFNDKIESFVTAIDNRIEKQNSEMLARTKYQGGLVSENIWQRVMTVFGHNLLMQIAIFVVAGFFALILG